MLSAKGTHKKILSYLQISKVQFYFRVRLSLSKMVVYKETNFDKLSFTLQLISNLFYMKKF